MKLGYICEVGRKASTVWNHSKYHILCCGDLLDFYEYQGSTKYWHTHLIFTKMEIFCFPLYKKRKINLDKLN